MILLINDLSPRFYAYEKHVNESRNPLYCTSFSQKREVFYPKLQKTPGKIKITLAYSLHFCYYNRCCPPNFRGPYITLIKSIILKS